MFIFGGKFYLLYIDYMAKGRKTGGRKAGTPNKATAFGKAVIQELVSDYANSSQLREDIRTLDPKDRLDVMVKLITFIVPKPQSIALDITTEATKTIEDELQQLSQENDNL